jgi:hypothetical protein
VEGAQAPEQWLVSRVCEEFGCLPSEALVEIEEGPTQLVLDIMELRAYAGAKRIVEQVYEASKRAAISGGEMPDMPVTPMVRRVVEIMQELEG